MQERGSVEQSFNFVNSILNKEDNILEIGCNHGSLLNLLFDDGYKKITGIDIREERLNIGKETYPKIKEHLFLVENNQILPYKDNTFDVVMLFDVLEHIPNVADYLYHQIYRVLKPDGLLIMSTPNKFTNTIFHLLKDRKHPVNFGHISLQTKKSLNKMLQKTKFKKIKFHKLKINSYYHMKLRESFGWLFGNLFIFLYKIVNKLPAAFRTNYWVTALTNKGTSEDI